MSRLLLESGPPDALALENGSGVVLLEDVDAALERRDPLYVRIDRPNWRISWTAGFNINLQGVVVAPPEAPVGRQLTERPLLAAPVQLNQRTWLWNYNPNLIAQDRMTAGAKLTDRPGVPPYYREWSQSLLQRTLAPLPPGKNLLERPTVPPWYRTWTVTLAPPVPFAQTNWPLTTAAIRPSNLGTWTVTLQQSTLAPAVVVQRPLFNVDWQVPRGHQHAIALRTWINVGVPQELYPSFVTGWDIGQGIDWRRSWTQSLLQTTLSIPAVTLPDGRSITDRPGVPPWYRSWLVSLQQSTLAPPPGAVRPAMLSVLPPRGHQYPVTLRSLTLSLAHLLPPPAPVVNPVGAVVTDRPLVLRWFHSWLVSPLRAAPATATPPVAIVTELPPRGHQHAIALRTWINTGVPEEELFPSFVTGWGTGRGGGGDWWRSWTVNLLQSTLSTTPGTVRSAMITVLPPRGHQHPNALRTWTAQYNANLIGKDLLPFAQLVWPPGPAPVFMSDLRTLTARHNFDLVDVFPEPPVEPPEPGVGGEITAGYFSKKKWHDLRALINAEKAAAAHAEQLKRSAAKKTLQAAVKATEEIVQGIHAGEGMPVIEPLQMALEAAASAQRLSDVLSNAKRAVRLAQRARAEMDMDEEEEAIAFLLLS